MPAHPSSWRPEFAAALLDGAAPPPRAVTSHNSATPARRFAVYRNNVHASLIGVLEGRYRAVARIVGEEFFRAMARAYVAHEPPRSAVLLAWGETFADFVRTFEPAAGLPYLPDVARLEWAWHAAYHAADAAAMEVTALTSIDPQALAQSRIDLHPSARLVVSAYPVVTIWEMNAGDVAPGPVDFARAEAALLLRPHLNVEVVRIPEGADRFIAALQAGLPLIEAARVAQAAAPAFDLQVNFAGLIRRGAIAGVAPAAG